MALEIDRSWQSFVDILRWRAHYEPDKLAFVFVLDGEAREARLTFAELDREARRIGALLQQQATPGERVLLLYQPGLEYVCAILGCMYAGMIAIPAYPPRLNHNLTRLTAIMQDAQATIALTTSNILGPLRRKFATDLLMQQLQWLATDTVSSECAQDWREGVRSKDTLALLQYTSGSTGKPKGVMITHDNLMHNARYIQMSIEMDASTQMGSWLPPYHDMGLMGGILETLYVGSSSVLMAPAMFLQQPLRWLRMLSRHQIYVSGGPNFAFDLCVEKATPEQLVELDLSNWQVAFSGAEPVRAETMRRFTETFAPYGFREEAFYPCYGMAETTLFISGGSVRKTPRVLTFDAAGIEQGQIRIAQHDEAARFLVGCGYLRAEQHAVIVDPVTRMRCAPEQIGEIWMAAPNVTQGYWGKPEATAETFQAFVADSGDGPFLRTGDLGFFYHDELFITGRLKDVIIIRGRNLYPQDIEQVVGQCHPALRQNSCAAFAVAEHGVDHLVLVQEVGRHYDRWDVNEIVQSIREAVLTEFDVSVAAVDLLRTGTIYKTSSGKIQRQASRQAFLQGALQSVYRWHLDACTWPQQEASAEAASPESGDTQSERQEVTAQVQVGEEKIVAWLVAHLAEHAQLNPQQIDLQAPLVRYGLNSLQAVGLSGELERWLGRSLSPTLVYEYPSIAALAHYLAGEAVPAVEMPDQQDHDAVQRTGGIAVVGMACRFPGASTPEEFWQFLQSGGDGIIETPSVRWDSASARARLMENAGDNSLRWGGFLPEIDQFDAGFFHIAPREAEHLDPQQRLLLETSWEAFEQAGLLPASLAGSQTGVFIGISSNDYYTLHHGVPAYHQAHTGTGNAHSVAANRLSYFFDFHGPSMAIDTACSSSLVALHQACQSLRQGECTVALAGGVNVMLSPELTSIFERAHMMAADGHCKTFDATADGYVRGEGCGVVILKPLEDAQRDGNQILAVIRGSAVNQDGASNGLTAPNGLAQEAVLRQALRIADVQPEQIGYVETHGTGTVLGDPIEFNALQSVLMARRTPEQCCVLGALKTNIGHLEAAAGIASVIKVVLSLRHGMVPPNLHFSTVNPHIALDGTTFVFPTETQQWSDAYERRIAGVSAFGFGGTNAHVILEAAPLTLQQSAVQSERPLHLLTLSARSASALQQQISRYQHYLASHPTTPLADVCFSANTGRTSFAYRQAIIAETSEQLQARLVDLSATVLPVERVKGTTRPRIAFLFTGQGSHYHGMALQLYETQPTFRYELERCDEILREYLDYSILAVLYASEHATLLEETEYAQPVLFALEYALAMLWRSWGIVPDMVMGHSVGEYVAACVAGMMSLEDGLKLIARRGQLMQALPRRGAMLAVRADADRLAPILEPLREQVSLAAINGPDQVVLAGDEGVLQVIERRLEAERIVARSLPVSHAFHSPLMEPMLDQFALIARDIAFHPLQVPLVANLTGQVVPVGDTLSADYWRQQTRSTVQFALGLRTLAQQGCTIFLEIGPHTTLTQMGKHCLQGEHIWHLSSLHREQQNWHTLLTGLASLYTRGCDVQWSGFDRDYRRQRVDVPMYPFERRRYWFEHISTSQQTLRPVSDVSLPRHPLLGTALVWLPSASMYVWERDLDAQPAQGGNVSFDFEELALAAATAAYGPGTYRVYASDIKQPLSFAVQETRKMQITLTLDAEQRVVFSVYGQVLASAHPWMVYAVGKIQRSEEQGHETEEMAQRIALTPTRTASVAEEPLLHELARAASVQERQIILETHLKRRVAAVLHLPVEELDSEQSLIALGADSLMALELKKQLEVELAIRIPVVVFLQVPTIKHLSAYLLEQIANPDQLLAGPESLSAQHPGASSPHDVSQMSSDQQATPSFDTEMLVTQIEHLSDEQIHVLLQQMLQEQKETDDK